MRYILPTLPWGGGPAKPVEGFFVVSVRQARSLRKTMSPTEIRLWRILRLRPEGLKFRRQHPLGEITFDFFCPSAALAVEVDGLAHDFEVRARRDERRDAWAATKGVKPVRIAAEEVRRNLDGVVAHILDECRARTPPPHFVRSPSPAKAGEDEVR